MLKLKNYRSKFPLIYFFHKSYLLTDVYNIGILFFLYTIKKLINCFFIIAFLLKNASPFLKICITNIEKGI